jgi:putative transcriptional regulator
LRKAQKGVYMNNKIRIERAIKDITQADLAEAVGVSRQTINAMESNKYVPSAVLAMKIARYFGKTFEEVFMLMEGD